jgi:alkaline phosphatase
VRGNDLLGLVRDVDDYGQIEPDYKKDMLGRPLTTLSYTGGPGYAGASNDQPEGPKKCCSAPKTFKGITSGRPDLSKVDTTDPDYLQEAVVPLVDEQHAGEDVAIFATGVNAYLVHGSMEENWIFYVMADTLGFKRNLQRAFHRLPSSDLRGRRASRPQ